MFQRKPWCWILKSIIWVPSAFGLLHSSSWTTARHLFMAAKQALLSASIASFPAFSFWPTPLDLLKEVSTLLYEVLVEIPSHNAPIVSSIQQFPSNKPSNRQKQLSVWIPVSSPDRAPVNCESFLYHQHWFNKCWGRRVWVCRWGRWVHGFILKVIRVLLSIKQFTFLLRLRLSTALRIF